MKKKLSLSILLLLVSMALSAFTYNLSNPNVLWFRLSVGIINPRPIGGHFPRTPIQAPEAGLDGHTLYLAEGHPACTLLIMVANEEAVYEVEVPEGVDVVELPATLTGTYELQLYYEDSNFYFYSEIELL